MDVFGAYTGFLCRLTGRSLWGSHYTGLLLRNLNQVTIMGIFIYIVNNRVSPI